MVEKDLHRRIFRDYGTDENLKKDVEQFNATVKDLSRYNLKSTEVAKAKAEARQRIVEATESRRDAELAMLQKKAADLKDVYVSKLEKSTMIDADLRTYNVRYGAMTDEELRQVVNDYHLGKVLVDRNEVDTISAQLRERKMEEVSLFRQEAHRRGYDRPWERLDPGLFEKLHQVERAPYGTVPVEMKSNENPGAKSWINVSVEQLLEE